jgi:hypothetical protein
MGGYSATDNADQSSIHKLICDQLGCKWSEMVQQLKNARSWFVAMMIPNHLTNCTKTLKVLVTTGLDNSLTSVKSEVIDLEDASNICQNLEDYPIQVYGAFGGLLNQGDPLVCGGRSPATNVCYVVNQPGQSSEMLEERAWSSSLTLNSSHLWVTGGFNSNAYLQTSEFVSIGQPSVKAPDLPNAVGMHCLVRVNSSTVLLCGGYNGQDILNECHYMDWEDHSWSQGPSMMTKRALHSCGIFKSAAHQGRNIVIAAGGQYNEYDYIDSVEFLDLTTNTWNEGKIYLDFNYIICVCVTLKKVSTFWSSRIVINLDLVVML